MPKNNTFPAEVQASLIDLDKSLYYKGSDWDALVESARSITIALEQSSFFDDLKRREQQICAIEVLQRLAYHDVDAGGVADLAEWCLEHWLQLHHAHPDDVAVLQEARGLLLPAVDYLRRAVDQATSKSSADGPLLVTAAEAYMSIGNVSSSRTNHEHFCRAIQYLRTASGIPGFPLPAYLQSYLDEYGGFSGCD
ncbi:hypothetical protein FKW77_010199 [Venturia effusa]|uniref:Uncharacterized protein n=1 Tax=Venturia effusa TaxID=50376 RepID=A0A517KXK4_9PEZI|nr:hypothetical protein FKW77_010199 [Venturia effusa]